MNIQKLVEIHSQKIQKETIVFTIKTRRWCQCPYEGHPKGCPNFNKNELCPPKYPYRIDILDKYNYFMLVYADFNFKQYKKLMKNKYQEWSEKEIACVLYWQGSLKKILKTELKKYVYDEMFGAGSGFNGCASMEAAGIDVFQTLRNNKIEFEVRPKTKDLMVCLLMSKNNREKKDLLNWI